MNAEAAYLDGAPLTGEITDAAFLLETGWTWEEYLSTPQEVVEMMIVLMEAKGLAMKRATEG